MANEGVTYNERLSGRLSRPEKGRVVRNTSNGLAQKSRRTRSVFNVKLILATVSPWCVILGLIYIAFFTQPGTLGKTVQPSPISNVDRFYGATRVGSHTLWLTGNMGKIVKSTDGGRNWVIQPTPDKANLQAISAWNADRAVAVGNGANVLVTRDGGSHWSKAESVPHAKVFNKLIGVQALPDGHALAVGENGAILKSTDYGENWQKMRPFHQIIFNDVTDAGQGLWVVGEEGTILYSDDGGSTWNKQDTGVNSTLTAASFRDPEHGVVAGLSGTLLTTADGGKNWRKIDLPTSVHLFSVGWNGRQWLVAGASGVVVSAGANAGHWQVSHLGRRNFSWHTNVLPNGHGWLLTGSSVGFYAHGSWKRILSGEEENTRG